MLLAIFHWQAERLGNRSKGRISITSQISASLFTVASSAYFPTTDFLGSHHLLLYFGLQSLLFCVLLYREGNGTPLQYSCLENPMDRGAWWAAVHGVAKLDTTEWLHFHFSASCIGEGNGNPFLGWRIPGTEEPGRVPSMGSHRVRHDWSNLAAAYVFKTSYKIPLLCVNTWTEEPGRLQFMGSLESDVTEQLHFHFSLSCIGEGNGNPLQCSCLENPRDGKPGWLLSMGSHRVEYDWSDAAAALILIIFLFLIK